MSLFLRGLRKVHPSLAPLLRQGAPRFAVLFRGRCPRWLDGAAQPLPLVGMYAAEVDADELARLDGHPGVKAIHLDRTLACALQLSRARLGLTPALASAWRGRGVGVALLDSGCAPHPDLEDALCGFVDLVANLSEPYDDFGHGTHLAGIIAGRGRLDARFAGLAPEAHLLPVKVLNEEGVGRESTIIRALEAVLRVKDAHSLRVVNLSLGGHAYGDGEDDPLCRAAEAVWRRGLVVVTTAGNEGRRGEGTIRSPGTSPLLITVGAVTRRGRVARFSSRGAPTGPVKPDLVAPGTGVVSTRAQGATLDLRHPERRVGEGYLVQSGSSVATAMVSGALALLLEKEPELTPDEAKERLLATAQDLGWPQSAQGAGLLAVGGLLAASPRAAGTILGRRVLRLGDHGEDVWYAQNRLNLLGHTLVGPASGLYDQRTAVAVARFQGGQSLPVTGVLDLETGRRLAATGALGRRTLHLGDDGVDVAELQRRLGLTPSGHFDVATQSALLALQRELGLPACGVADRHTFWGLGAARPPAELPLVGEIPYP